MTHVFIQSRGQVGHRPVHRGKRAACRAVAAIAWTLASAFGATAANLAQPPATPQAMPDAQAAPAKPGAAASTAAPQKRSPGWIARTKAKGQDGDLVRPTAGDFKKPRRPPPPPPAIDAQTLLPIRTVAPGTPDVKPRHGEPVRPAAAKEK